MEIAISVGFSRLDDMCGWFTPKTINQPSKVHQGFLTRRLLDEPGLVLPVHEDEVHGHAGQDDGDADACKKSGKFEGH